MKLFSQKRDTSLGNIVAKTLQLEVSQSRVGKSCRYPRLFWAYKPVDRHRDAGGADPMQESSRDPCLSSRQADCETMSSNFSAISM